MLPEEAGTLSVWLAQWIPAMLSLCLPLVQSQPMALCSRTGDSQGHAGLIWESCPARTSVSSVQQAGPCPGAVEGLLGSPASEQGPTLPAGPLHRCPRVTFPGG